MKIETSTDRVRHRLGESVLVRVSVHNDGPATVEVTDWLTEYHFRVNGVEEDGGMRAESNPERSLVAAGERITLEQPFEPSIATLFAGTPSLVTFGLELLGTVSVDGRAERFVSPVMPVEIDLTRVRPLLTEREERSSYLAEGEDVFYASSFSRAYEPRTTKLNVMASKARALSPLYLVDDRRVFRAGRLQRKVDSAGFRVLNAIFSGNPGVILTSYGDAKVEDPASFEVLDDGRNKPLPSPQIAYGAGYGRDRRNVYYFNEETSTPHAVRLKACRDPASFESLPYAHGRDAENVYSEATRIAGADRRTWRVLNAWYTVDARRVFYGTRAIAEADPASFEVLPDPVTGRVEGSSWARDARSHFEGREPRAAADYLAAVERAGMRT